MIGLVSKWGCHLIVGILLGLILAGCSAKTYKLSKNARVLYQKGRYTEALPYFIASIENGKKKTSWLLKAAETGLKAGDVEHAYTWLDEIIKDKGYKELEAYVLMGETLQQLGHFEDAVIVYKTWLREADRKDKKRSFVKRNLLQADRGVWMQRNKPVALIESFGPSVNTKTHQFGARYSPTTKGKIYYTSTDGSNSSIFYTIDNQGLWTRPVALDTSHNKGNKAILDIIGDGQKLIFYKGSTWKDGNVYYRDYTSSSSDYLLGVNTYGFDGRMGLSLYRDSILFFASDKPGGYGGYDLYMSLYRNGKWEYPVNLGPGINSRYDEITPYMCNDGRTLYYSTNSSYSSGGFDVVRAHLNDKSLSWSEVENVGFPINSGADDRHFVLNNDGYKALLSSNRPKGEGGFDIYNIFFDQLRTEQFYSNDPFIFAVLYDELKSLKTDWQGTYQYFEKKKQLLKKNNVRKQKYTLLLHPIFIEAEEYLSDQRVLTYLERIATVMKSHPNLLLEINGYLSPKPKPWQTLYTSFQKAEIVRRYLKNLGIASNRIITRGYGDRFEIAKEVINGHQSEVGRKFNSRIEFKLKGHADYLKVEYEKPKVPEYYRMRYPEEYPEGIYYKIYLQSSGQMFINPLISKQNKAIIERIGKGRSVDYLIGVFSTYRDAKFGLQNLDSNRFKQLRIVPYYKGSRLSRNELMDFVSKYPDLNQFLKENK